MHVGRNCCFRVDRWIGWLGFFDHTGTQSASNSVRLSDRRPCRAYHLCGRGSALCLAAGLRLAPIGLHPRTIPHLKPGHRPRGAFLSRRRIIHGLPIPRFHPRVEDASIVATSSHYADKIQGKSAANVSKIRSILSPCPGPAL